MSLPDQLLGQLARDIPGASRVFDSYHLDFCCAGKQSLQEAATAAHVNLEQVIAELETLRQRKADLEKDWSQAGTNELIEHIVNTFHFAHRELLPELIRLARRVERVHAAREHCPNGLADILHTLHQDLESHMLKEERVLFPMLGQRDNAQVAAPISTMRSEHRDHGETLHQIESLTNNMTLPAGACNSWRALYEGLMSFRKDLMTHIHLENNVLFERFASSPSI